MIGGTCVLKPKGYDVVIIVVVVVPFGTKFLNNN